MKKARIVATPDSYPTCSTLSIQPVHKAGLINPKSIIIDAKSGTSRAGRGTKVDSLYCEVNESIKAYGGNPFVCAVESEALIIYKNEKIVEHVKEVGHYLWEKFEELKASHSCIVDHRGIRLIQGLEFKENPIIDC